MKFTPVILLIASTAVFAQVYNAPSIIAMAPPRSTHVLIEPNGNVWATAFYVGASAQSELVITGHGDRAIDWGPPQCCYSTVIPDPIPIKMKVELSSTLHLTFTGGRPYAYNAPIGIGARRAPFDVDLKQEALEELALPSKNYSENLFSMSITGARFTGYNGNCIFSGKLRDEKFYKSVALTFENSCYAEDNVTFIKKNSKMEGVMFASTHYFNTSSGTMPTYVLIMVPKTGKTNTAFSRMFFK